MALTWKNINAPQFNNSGLSAANSGFAAAAGGGGQMADIAQMIRGNRGEDASNRMLAMLGQAQTPEQLAQIQSQMMQNPQKGADLGMILNQARAQGGHMDDLLTSHLNRAETSQGMGHREAKLPGELDQLRLGNERTDQLIRHGDEEQAHTRSQREREERTRQNAEMVDNAFHQFRQDRMGEHMQNAPAHMTPQEQQMWAIGQAEDDLTRAEASHFFKNQFVGTGEGQMSVSDFYASELGQRQKAMDDKYIEQWELNHQKESELAKNDAGVWGNISQGHGFKQLGMVDGELKPLTEKEARNQAIGSDASFQRAVALATGGKDGGFKFDFSEIDDKGLRDRMKSMYGDMSSTMVSHVSKNVQKAGARNSKEFADLFISESLDLMRAAQDRGKQFNAPVEQTNTLGLAEQGVQNARAAAGLEDVVPGAGAGGTAGGGGRGTGAAAPAPENADLGARLSELGYGEAGEAINKQLPPSLEREIKQLVHALESGQQGSGRSLRTLSEADKEKKAKQLDDALEKARNWKGPNRRGRRSNQ